MINRAGAVKVMDFGIARAISDASSPMTQTAAVIGTAQYLSPEQARGEQVDARSDVYSLGCVLFEILTAVADEDGPGPGQPLTHEREGAQEPLVAFVGVEVRDHGDGRGSLRHPRDGESLEVGGVTLRTLQLDGHSPDGLGLFVEGTLLVGDHLSPCEIPFIDDAVPAIRRLAADGIPVAATLVYSAAQGILAAHAGASMVTAIARAPRSIPCSCSRRGRG